MKGLLLIGGQATRLYPLSKYIAKSLLPICDRELLHYQIAALARAGIGEIVLAAGYKVEQIREYAAGYSGIRLYVSEEPEPRGTAGAIAQAAEYLDSEPVVVLNADILSDVSIAQLIETHRSGGRPATIMGKAVDDPSRFGLLRVSGAEILGFSEKPEGNLGPGPHYINAGAYVLEPEVVAAIPTDRPVSIERETFPQLIAERGPLSFYAHEGLWYDVGTFESYFAANFALLNQRFTFGETALWGERDDAAIFKDSVYLSKLATLGPSVDLFHRVIAMAGTRIGARVRLQDTILMPGAQVGDNCALSACIVGPGAELKVGSIVQNTLFIAGEQPQAFFPQAVEV
jgi:mannose-1-phosphate guanylyltransferase